jgi:hypothetical protein
MAVFPILKYDTITWPCFEAWAAFCLNLSSLRWSTYILRRLRVREEVDH